MINLEQKFKESGIDFELYNHRAIYTNEDALIVKQEEKFSGTETKSLYLKDKKANNYIFLTYTTKKSDFKRLSNLVGQKLSVVSSEQMEKQTGQKPGAVSPFGYDVNVPIIVDERLLGEEKLVFAPGRPDQTMVVKVSDLNNIIDVLDLEPYFLPLED